MSAENATKIKTFRDMNIKLNRRFEGDRIRIEKVEGDEIIIHDFEIKESKIKREDEDIGKCLYLQVELRGVKYILWGNYRFLIEQIQQVDRESLPFKTTIKNEHGYIFK